MKKNKIIDAAVISILFVAILVSVNFVGEHMASDHSHEDMLAAANISHSAKVNIKVDEKEIGRIATDIGSINSEVFNFVNKKAKKSAGLRELSTQQQNQRLKDILAKRKESMKALAKADPRVFLAFAISKKTKDKLPKEVQKDVEIETTATGQLQAIHIDDFDNHENSYFEYFISSKNARTPVYFPVAPTSVPGSTVKLPGYLIDGVFVAGASGGVEVAPAPAIQGTGDQKTLVLLINFADSPPVPFTKEQAQTAIFNGQFQKFYKEQSYNKTSFSGDTYGWIQLASTNYSASLYDAPVQNFVVSNGINLANYGRVVYILNVGYEGGYSGVGKSNHLINGVDYNLSESWINTSTEYAKPSYWGNQPFTWTNLDFVLSHELGHALGVMHANGWDCDSVAFAGDNCQHLEYGNYFDTMGNGNRSLHFNGFYKELLGWIPPSEELTITSTGKKFIINPLESATSAKKLAKIVMQGTTTAPFYLEYRKAIGFDANLATSSLTSNQNGLFVNNIIRNIGNPYPRLLDMSPTTLGWYNDTMAATLNTPATLQFSDAGSGITINGVAPVTGGMSFNVLVAAPKCIRHPIILTPTYGSNTVAQGTYGYFGASFINNDSLICSASLFNATPHLPPTWTYSINPSGSDNMPVASGDFGWKYANFAVPETAAAGTYPLSLDIVNSVTGQTKTINWTVKVIPKPIISSIDPTSGAIGTVVTVHGTNLTGEYPYLSFSNSIGYSSPSTVFVDSNTIKFTVPAITTVYCSIDNVCPGATTTPDGVYQLQYYVNGAPANVVDFRVGPVIATSTPSLTVSNTSATISNVHGTIDRNRLTTGDLSIGFTLTNDGSTDVYMSKDGAIALQSSVVGTAVASFTASTPNPGTRPGDTPNVYSVPAGTSRTFSYYGVIDNSSGTAGMNIFKINAINFGTSLGSPTTLNTTSNLEALVVSKYLDTAVVASCHGTFSDACAYTDISSCLSLADGKIGTHSKYCTFSGNSGASCSGGGQFQCSYLNEQECGPNGIGGNYCYFENGACKTTGSQYGSFTCDVNVSTPEGIEKCMSRNGSNMGGYGVCNFDPGTGGSCKSNGWQPSCTNFSQSECGEVAGCTWG